MLKIEIDETLDKPHECGGQTPLNKCPECGAIGWQIETIPSWTEEVEEK